MCPGIQQILNTGRMIGHGKQAGQPVGDASEHGIRLLLIFPALYDDETHLRTRIVGSDPKLDGMRRVAQAVVKSSGDVGHQRFMNAM
ncbi:hypothetical protein [Methylobacterium fujisawaense]|uniref:hypothetical protein n=1 Tax=Methylobacterium fujisawaense TaxID=107400 RepID=UPI00313CC008